MQRTPRPRRPHQELVPALLLIYAGGDTPARQDGTKAAFKARFPDIALTLIVDYSRYHGVRKDPQEPGSPSPPLAFGFPYGTAAVGSDAPRNPLALVDPKWKGRIASSYLHDDDAVLYLYTLYARTYGWDWVAELAAPDVRFARLTISLCWDVMTVSTLLAVTYAADLALGNRLNPLARHAWVAALLLLWAYLVVLTPPTLTGAYVWCGVPPACAVLRPLGGRKTAVALAPSRSC
ncbi:hypothetical protein ACFWIY_15110 [Streptomyces sioyaensis]|uniref:hypothetical protein n=1 Tax=Streptomyces sioyaensis TaxID=67364 RepID=UPI0036691B8C